MPMVSKVHQASYCFTCDSSSPSPDSELFWTSHLLSLNNPGSGSPHIRHWKSPTQKSRESPDQWHGVRLERQRAGNAGSSHLSKLLSKAKQPAWQAGGRDICNTHTSRVCSRAGKDRPNCAPFCTKLLQVSWRLPKRLCPTTGPNSCKSGWPQRRPLQREL